MGELVRFPRPLQVDRALERLEAELKAERELERRTVAEAFAAVERGDFDAEPVRNVIRGRAGDWREYVALCERIKLVAQVARACGRGAGCSCAVRCERWPHCAGGPEGI